jgi:hypothetical protein
MTKERYIVIGGEVYKDTYFKIGRKVMFIIREWQHQYKRSK